MLSPATLRLQDRIRLATQRYMGNLQSCREGSRGVQKSTENHSAAWATDRSVFKHQPAFGKGHLMGNNWSELDTHCREATGGVSDQTKPNLYHKRSPLRV